MYEQHWPQLSERNQIWSCIINTPYSNWRIVTIRFLSRCGQLLWYKAQIQLYMKFAVPVFFRFSDFSKLCQSELSIYEFSWLAKFGRSKENLLKTSCKAVLLMSKVARPVSHDVTINWKQSASAPGCDVSCDIPYYLCFPHVSSKCNSNSFHLYQLFSVNFTLTFAFLYAIYSFMDTLVKLLSLVWHIFNFYINISQIPVWHLHNSGTLSSLILTYGTYLLDISTMQAHVLAVRRLL